MLKYFRMLHDMDCTLSSCAYAVKNVLCLSIGLKNTHCLFVCVCRFMNVSQYSHNVASAIAWPLALSTPA